MFAFMTIFLSRSALRLALKSDDCRSRKSRATPSSSISKGSGEDSIATEPDNISVIARSNCSICSISGCLLMTSTRAGSETFQSSELKLLDCPFRAAEFLGNVSDAFLLHESFDDDRPLIFRQTVDELKQGCPALDFLPAGSIEFFDKRRIDGLFRIPGPVRNDICGDPEKPHGKRHASPFEARQVCQRMMKHFGGQILGLVPRLYPADDERVYAPKV